MTRFWRVEWLNKSGKVSRGRVGGSNYFRALARAKQINPNGEIITLALIEQRGV